MRTGKKSNDSVDVLQGDLFGGIRQLQTRVIKRKNDFDSLFDGFHTMRAVSYVVSPDLLLEFFEERGYSNVEVVVGENLSRSYKEGLQKKNLEVVERLAVRVENGSLLIHVPSKSVHSKLYLLGDEGRNRVIQTSANLTETARQASRQTNYAWYMDLAKGDPLLDQFLADFQSHLQGCSLFMEDLTSLFKERPDTERTQLIELWLKGGSVEEQEVETKRVFQELSANLLAASNNNEDEETLITLSMPESSEARRRTERLLKPLEPISSANNQIHVNGSAFIRYVYENHQIPLLILDMKHRDLLIGLGGSMKTLTEELPEPESVDKGLNHLESYFQTVDSGQSANPLYAKTSMFEALLYIFAAPFANEYMKMKRSRFGMIDARGPRFLYIYGPSQNGKSTFLRFCLKLLTGSGIEPLSRQDFTKTKIFNASLVGTAFPLIFDDVDPSRTQGLEDVFKSYWERWWTGEYVSPQIIISSNTPGLKEWAKSRVKRIDFDVHFSPNEQDKEKLAELFSEPSTIFKWFSHVYMRHLAEGELPSDDELKLGRHVFQELYSYAKRDLPEFFPNEPIEKLYDPGRRDWRDLVFELGKAELTHQRDRILVTFSSDFQFWEINDYQSYLPQTIKYQRKGNTLIVENAAEFDMWLGKQPKSQNLLRRLFRINRS